MGVALVFVPSIVAFGLAFLFVRWHHHASNQLARRVFAAASLSLLVLSALLLYVEIWIVTG